MEPLPSAPRRPGTATPRHRRVLVLEGGGAKGAYGFGALLAFKEMGVEFDAVAGTSVGALNAVLWSSNCLAEGRAIWESISFDSIYPIKIVDAKRHSRAFVRAVGTAYALLQFMWAAKEGTPLPPEIELPAKVSLAVVEFLFLCGPLYLVFGRLGFLAGLLWWGYLVAADPQSEAGQQSRSIAVAVFGTMFVFGLLMLVDLHYDRRLSDAIVGPLMLLLAFVVPLTVMAVDRYLDDELKQWFGGVPILDGNPLGDILTKILSANALRIPTWVTVSRLTRLLDPDRADVTVIVGVGSDATPETAPTPAMSNRWIPDYTDIQFASIKQATDLCRASAAMPFGIVLPVKVNGVDCADGGVADNCPAFPFQNDPSIEEIFAVLLNPHETEDDAIQSVQNPDEWREIRRALDLAQYTGPVGNQTKENTPPRVVPFRELEHSPRIVPFYPSGAWAIS